MKKIESFTEGRILAPLLKFATPVMLALMLQALYGSVDLMIVGRFGGPADVSAVSTGTQIMHSFTMLISGLATAVTVLIGTKIGEGRKDLAGEIIGSGVYL